MCVESTPIGRGTKCSWSALENLHAARCLRVNHRASAHELATRGCRRRFLSMQARAQPARTAYAWRPAGLERQSVAQMRSDEAQDRGLGSF